MKAYDLINKIEIEVDYDSLVELMKNHRQVDFIHADKKQDVDGYLTFDADHWTMIGENKFMRTYSNGIRQLREFTYYNSYDMRSDFRPEEAKEIQIN